MFNPSVLFGSVEDVWLIWAGACVALAVLARTLVRGWRRRGFAGLLSGEEGAAYSLGYVMVLPIYMLLVCVAIEATLILVVKMGTVYAAYAAARSHIVWSSAEPNRLDERQRIAAVRAMAPFASSNPLHAAGAGVSGSAPGAADFAAAYQAYSSGSAPASYLTAKYAYADRATQVEASPVTGQGNGDVTVTLTYEMPLNIPGAGRILGGKASWPGARFSTRRIETTATLPNEGPVSASGTLGIDYVSE